MELGDLEGEIGNHTVISYRRKESNSITSVPLYSCEILLFYLLFLLAPRPMAVGQILRCGEPLNTTANYWESQVPGVWSNLKDVRYTREQAASNKKCGLYYDL